MNKEAPLKYSPEDVVKLLRDYSGHTVAHLIHEAIKNNPYLKRIIIIGLPGIGKTTVLIGVRRTLIKEYAHLVRSTRTLLFDPIRKEYIELMADQGFPAESIPDLPKEKQDYFGEFLIYAFYDGTNGPNDGVVFMEEMPAKGKYPRGQSVLEVMAESNTRAYKKHRKVENFVISLIGDPKVVLKAKRVRAAAAASKNDYDLIINLKKVGVDLREATEEDKTSVALLNMYLSEATEKQIDMLHTEEEELMEAVYAQALSHELGHLVAHLPNMIPVPEGIQLDTKEEWDYMVKACLYAANQLLAMGFKPGAFAVAINPMLGDIRH
jgi:hypothetical protein